MIYTHFVKVIGFDTRAIQFSSFSLHFREDRDSEIAPTEERLESDDLNYRTIEWLCFDTET